MKSKFLGSFVAVVYLSLLALPIVLVAPASAQSGKPKELSCSQKVAGLNSRSAILTAYKKSEDKKYKAFRQKWVTRISYAGQWVPKDAKKARDGLYKYDALHKTTAKEIDKQIGTYKYLEQQPLDCSKAKAPVVARKLDEVKGVKKTLWMKRAVGGNALISKYKRAEFNYVKKDFDSISSAMIKKLHNEKVKHPTPLHPRLPVNS